MLRALTLLCAVLLLFACSDPARDTFETARFEEQQFNRQHAVELYRQIMTDHPDSPYARQAAERLQELQGKP